MSAQAPSPPLPAAPLKHVFLPSGALYCGAGPATISTVLGSCVALCLIDRHNRACGMNHYVLPSNPTDERSLRYGDVAIERLAEKMRKLGCPDGDMRAKIFGGAAVLPFGDGEDTVGTKNVKLALEWLRGRGIPVVARRTGGKHGLLVRLDTATGRVLVRKVSSSDVTVDLGGDITVQDSRLGFGRG